MTERRICFLNCAFGQVKAALRCHVAGQYLAKETPRCMHHQDRNGIDAYISECQSYMHVSHCNLLR